jgi:hypothetical protein
MTEYFDKNMVNRYNISIELGCMTFSTICYFACGALVISRQMHGTGFFMMVLSAACVLRVFYILINFFRE